MVMTDPIADFLTRIRNANMVFMDKVEIPASKTKRALAEILKEEGFAQPKAVKDATMSYQHDSDKMELFVEEFLEQEKDAECRTSAVYQAYRNWCNDNGYFAENSRNFNQALRTIGTIVRRRPRDGGEKTTLLTGYRLLCRDFFC